MIQSNHRNASLVHSHIAVLQFAFFFVLMFLFLKFLRSRIWSIRYIEKCYRKAGYPKGFFYNKPISYSYLKGEDNYFQK